MNEHNRFFLQKHLMLFICLIFFVSFFVPLASTEMFDYSVDDLIGRESYKKISMDFKDASLTNVLKVFSEQAGLNFISSQGVQDRKVTLYLDNVPLQEALNKIISANNLKYELDAGSNIFVVKDAGRPVIETITKIYNLKYARLSASKLQQVVDAGPTTGGASAGGGGGGAGGRIEEAVKGILSANGKLMSDLRTNSLIVTDVPFQFDVIDRIVALLDVATPQVMIEVEMLDVSKAVVDDMGVTFGNSGTMMNLTGGSTDTRFPNFLADGKTLSAPPAFTYGTLSAAVFSATLNMLTTDTKTKFLARPRILTLSNETSEIRITTNEAIGKIKNISGEGASSTSTETAERAETGVSLKVTPQVDPQTGMVTMFIEPVVSQTKDSPIVVNGSAVKDPETRSSASTLMVKNGETIVVGGLIRIDDQNTDESLPFFSRIPILGMAFRHRKGEKEERELIVFITPHIIGMDNASAFAALDAQSPGAIRPDVAPYREQSSGFLRKDAVDNSLKRWDN